MKRLVPLIFSLMAAGAAAGADAPRPLEPMDMFELEWASDPRLSPDGQSIVYVRNFMDVQSDRRRANLWAIDFDGRRHRPVTSGLRNDTSPRWSPEGGRIVYVSSSEGSAQLFVRWLGSGETARLTQLPDSPRGVTWSPDGNWIAFTMKVPSEREPLAKMPKPPEGAKWAEPLKVIESLQYRSDGAGYLEEGFDHLFVVPADGGTPRQLTSGDFDHGPSVAWDSDGRSIVVSANRNEDWETDPLESELYRVSIEDGAIVRLTDRDGPDGSPAISPDGRSIAFTGFDDRYQGYQITRLYVMNRDGSSRRVLTGSLDRSVDDPVWSQDGRRIWFQYDDEGVTKIGSVSLDSRLETVASNVGGTSIGRPYPGGSFSLARNDRYVYTGTSPDYPADLFSGVRGRGDAKRLTNLNRDLLAFRDLGKTEELWWESSYDGRRIQGWLVTPPDFDPTKSYPLILEIHGGPFANYGPRFSPEIQLYAAAGYVVLYANPRGSTSYGEELGNLIHHNYPGQDYDDLMAGVDAVLERGFVDPARLYVTGGSGGGVLSAWIVGKTDRFRAAVVAKPVINWTSFALTADFYSFFHRYWFPGLPWEEVEHYWKRSPLSLVGNVSTPTMLLTGEEDYRTPISESEQFYQALKLRGVPTALVRVPGASHGIVARPSRLIAKPAHVLAWFERYGGLDSEP
ncbi:MAG: S9 family peptidase [Acidobacteria bacterium]|nr:S9 family peptidase [Acidobacteriota bacterium]